MKQIQKRLVLLNDVQEIEKLALFMDEIGEELSLPSDLQFNLCLALEEAVTNVVLYAYPGQSGREIELEARSDARALVFVLTDAGIAFDPTQVPDADVNLSLEERPIGGLGIFLIRKIMDEVSYQRMDGKNRLCMRKVVGKGVPSTAFLVLLLEKECCQRCFWCFFWKRSAVNGVFGASFGKGVLSTVFLVLLFEKECCQRCFLFQF